MKFSLEKQSLLSLLSKVQSIVEKRNTMPILVNVLIEADKDSLKLFATNLEVSIVSSFKAKITTPGKAVINAKNLFDIVKELGPDVIEIEKQKNEWLKITQGKSVFNIVGIKPEEFPVFPSISSESYIELDAELFKDMIEKTIFCVSHDETRYHLNGVFLEKTSDNGLRMVATDGHRLSLITRNSDDNVDLDNINNGVIIPRKGLHEIKKLLEGAEGTFKLTIEGAQLVVDYAGTLLMIRLIEGKYPNYKQLIPQKLQKDIRIRKELLQSSLKRVSLLSNQKSKGVTLAFSNNKMEITSNNPDLGDAREELDIAYSGDAFKIGFNAKYILDVLSSIKDEEVKLELKDQLSPGLMKPTNDSEYTCVIMPMRIW